MYKYACGQNVVQIFQRQGTVLDQYASHLKKYLKHMTIAVNV